MSRTDTCRSCEAPVVFVPSAATGKPMILDAVPKKGVVIVQGAEGSMLAQLEGPAPYGVKARVLDVYTDHHATCPHARQWKGKKR